MSSLSSNRGGDSFVLLGIGSDNGVSDAIDFQIYSVAEYKTTDGRVIRRREFVCLAKPVTITQDTTEIMPGEYQTRTTASRTALYWVPQIDLMSKITEHAEAISVPHPY